jgi:Domain of unknown function (DUF4337)
MEAHEAYERFERTHHAAHNGGEGPSFTTRAALTVAVLAAFLAVATFLTNETVKDAIQNQTKAADANAESISFSTQQEVALLAGAELTSLSASSDPGVARASKAGADSLDKHTKEFDLASKGLQLRAAEAKKEVKDANDSHLIYELSVVALQIGIVLASVSIIAKRIFLLYGGWGAGVAGIVLLILGLVGV